MRCFIALELPEEVKSELVKIQNVLKNIEGLKAKFIEKENLHLTIKFLGEISDVKVNKVVEKLSNIKLKPFKASLGKLGCFPSESYVRIIWISLEPSEKVKELSTLINNSLDSSDKRFESHITIARVKFVKDKDALQRKLKELKFEKKSFEVNSFVLKKSTLSSEGPVYGDVKTFSC